MAADQALIDAQALNIAYCHIVSPVDGRVGLRLVDAGNFVQAGRRPPPASPWSRRLQPMSVIFSVPEDALNKIAPKMRNGGQADRHRLDRANVKQLATGAVTVLDNQVDTTTGMVKLRAFFDNQDEALFPNQFVNIRLLVDTLQGAVAAPTAGVQHGAPGDYAYVVGADGKASVRVLKLGQTDGDFVQVTRAWPPATASSPTAPTACARARNARGLRCGKDGCRPDGARRRRSSGRRGATPHAAGRRPGRQRRRAVIIAAHGQKDGAGDAQSRPTERAASRP